MTNWLRRHRPVPDKLDTGTAAGPAAAETITSTMKKAGRLAAQRRIQDGGMRHCSQNEGQQGETAGTTVEEATREAAAKTADYRDGRSDNGGVDGRLQ